MSITVDVQIASTATDLPPSSDLQKWATVAVSNHKTEAEISLCIVDEEQSQTLNSQYRGKNKPTNVLSFPAQFPDGVDVPFLGDVVICATVVKHEANEQQKNAYAHWAHMVVHGVLHLLGYDHIEDKDAQIMEQLETQLLASLGYSCPYI